MPLAQYIPMACLAGVLVIVSYNMSGWRTFKALLKNPKSDVTVLPVSYTHLDVYKRQVQNTRKTEYEALRMGATVQPHMFYGAFISLDEAKAKGVLALSLIHI